MIKTIKFPEHMQEQQTPSGVETGTPQAHTKGLDSLPRSLCERNWAVMGLGVSEHPEQSLALSQPQ